MEGIKKLLAHRIRDLRKTRDMTQEKLAESTGLTTTHIGHIETGRRWPSAKVIDRIAAVLGGPEAILPPDAPPLLTAAEPTHREHTLADCKRAVDAALERQMAADAETRAKANAKTGPGAQDARERLEDEDG